MPDSPARIEGSACEVFSVGRSNTWKMRSAPERALCTVCHSSPKAVIGSKKFLNSSTKAVRVPRLTDQPSNVPRAPLQKSKEIAAAINICMMGEYSAEYLAASL